MRALRYFQLASVVALCHSSALYAQAPPPIHGVTGTLATETTIKEEHKAANKIVVAAKDGVDSTKDALVPAGKDGLTDLKPGTTVVIHYATVSAGAGAHEIDVVDAKGRSESEGIVTKIDRGKKEITIRYDNGKTEKLALTGRAAVDAGQDFSKAPVGTTRIVVDHSEDAGRKVAHYFKQKI